MTTDRVIAVICLAAFCSFLVVSAVYIREFDLVIVFAVAFALASFDFWKTLFRSDAGKNGSS